MLEDMKQRGAFQPPKISAYGLVEHDLIRCRGLIDAARDLALYRAQDLNRHDGMVQLISELNDAIEDIDAKLLKLAREAAVPNGTAEQPQD